MKRGLIFSTILLSLNFASAYYFGNYGSYSLSDILDSIDPSTAVLGVLFIVFLIFINFSLSKWLKDSKISGIASLAISFLIVYLLNKNYDIYGLVYGWGFADGTFTTILTLVVIVGAILIGLKYGWGTTMIILGALAILVGFIDSYSGGGWFLLGAILIIVGIFISNKWGKKDEIIIKR